MAGVTTEITPGSALLHALTRDLVLGITNGDRAMDATIDAMDPSRSACSTNAGHGGVGQTTPHHTDLTEAGLP